MGWIVDKLCIKIKWSNEAKIWVLSTKEVLSNKAYDVLNNIQGVSSWEIINEAKAAVKFD